MQISQKYFEKATRNDFRIREENLPEGMGKVRYSLYTPPERGPRARFNPKSDLLYLTGFSSPDHHEQNVVTDGILSWHLMLSPFVRWAGATLLNKTRYLAMPYYVFHASNYNICEWEKLLNLKGLKELYIDAEHVDFGSMHDVEKLTLIQGLVEGALGKYVFLQAFQFGIM